MSKIILHLDANSYFATLEQQAYPHLRGKPVGVAGKGPGERTVISGASIEAKKLGIKGAMSTWEALKICPQLIIIPANYDRYIFTSQRIFRLLETLSPKVEIFSIDEAFLELPAQETNSKFQTLNSKIISDLGFSASDFRTAEDKAYLNAINVALQAKRMIRRQIGEWVSVSVGISYGKTLAKFASELQKPDGLVVIRPGDFTEVAKKASVGDLCGIGYRLTPRLNQLGVETVYDLGRIPPKTLTDVFGDSAGNWMHRIGNGLDDNQLHSFHDLPEEKSVGHSYTLPRDLTSIEQAKSVLLLLAEKVGRRLRRKNFLARTVSVYFRFGEGGGWGERATGQEYLMDGFQIFQAGERILNRCPYFKPIRFINITVSDLAKQVTLTAPLMADQIHLEKLITAVDQINDRWGAFTIHRGRLNKIRERIFSLPDGRNKRLYSPQFNSFSKRI
ncbi:MAG TPA: DNA polymerase IV [Candidatus Saccharimonadales bacterium]|nr:DNA polymerase IV [Candidatus Saccharimonadales bacterium]